MKQFTVGFTFFGMRGPNKLSEGEVRLWAESADEAELAFMQLFQGRGFTYAVETKDDAV